MAGKKKRQPIGKKANISKKTTIKPDKSLKKNKSARKKSLKTSAVKMTNFPMVGLEALRAFFPNLPAVSRNIAYLIKQHLNQNHQSISFFSTVDFPLSSIKRALLGLFWLLPGKLTIKKISIKAE